VLEIRLQESVLFIRGGRPFDVTFPPIAPTTSAIPRKLVHVQNIGSEGIQAVLDAFLQGVDQREDGNDGKDSDGDPQQGENGTQQVGSQRFPGKSKAFVNQAEGEHFANNAEKAVLGYKNGQLKQFPIFAAFKIK